MLLLPSTIRRQGWKELISIKSFWTPSPAPLLASRLACPWHSSSLQVADGSHQASEAQTGASSTEDTCCLREGWLEWFRWQSSQPVPPSSCYPRVNLEQFPSAAVTWDLSFGWEQSRNWTERWSWGQAFRAQMWAQSPYKRAKLEKENIAPGKQVLPYWFNA